MRELIDRQQAIDRFNVIRPVDPKKDEYTKGIDVGIAMCIVTVKDQPTIQPEKTQLSKEDTTSDLISRQEAIDALVQCTNCGDEDTLREYVLKHSLDNGWTGGILEALDAVKDLPPAQPEPTYEQVEEYCKKRCLHVVTADFFESTKPQRLGHWIKHIDPFDGEQYECSECGVLWEFTDGTPEDNEAYFCPKCGAKMTISTK